MWPSVHVAEPMKERTMRVNIVGQGTILFVTHFDRMVRFYTDTLGLVPKEEHVGWIQFALGDSHFALHAIPPEYAEDIQIGDPPAVRWETPFKPVFHVEDLATAVSALLEQQVAPAQSDVELSHGRVDFVDPEGNVFQIAQR